MLNFFNQYWDVIISVITGGGISSLLTMRVGVKSAKADLMSKMQDIYGQMLSDMRTEIEFIRGTSCMNMNCEHRKEIIKKKSDEK